MSAYEVVDVLRSRPWPSDPVDFVVLNFANPDMVGHTGDMPATVEALEHVDRVPGQGARRSSTAAGAKVIVTADHGNAEDMLEPDGSTDTAHTTNPVPLIVLDEDVTLREGAGLGRHRAHGAVLLGLPGARGDDRRPLC